MRCYKKLNSKQRNGLETYLQEKTTAFLVMRNKSTQTYVWSLQIVLTFLNISFRLS